MKTRSQTTGLPHLRVPRAPAGWNRDADLATLAWEGVPALPPFVLADGSKPAIQQTVARVCYDEDALYVRFDCQDRDIWATSTQRDDPIYDEEVVEVIPFTKDKNEAPSFGTSAEFRKEIQDEHAIMSSLVKQYGVKQ